MSIKHILAILDLGETPGPSEGVALDLAGRFGAHVTGLALAIEPILPPMMMVPIPAELVASAREAAEQRAAEAARRFEARAGASNIAVDIRTLGVVAGAAQEVLAHHARLTDIVVIGQDNPDGSEPYRSELIEAAILDSGRPVLIVPYAGAAKMGAGRIVVAWDGSPTAARALHAALPLLAGVEMVHVLTVGKAARSDGVDSEGGTGADVAAYLARHGIRATIHAMPDGDIDVAAALLNHVADTGMNMIVMGGYGHSRLRQFVLGGVTRTILASMTVPVLMAH